MRFLILIFFLVGCANKPLIEFTPQKEVELGMTKAQVREIKGEPSRRAASNGYEFLVFKESGGLLEPYQQHVYRFKNGKLDQYGTINDFRSENVNVTIKNR